MKNRFPKPFKIFFNSHNRSLRKRIPLLICLLLVAVVSVYVIVSYLSLERFEFKVGQQRLKFLSTEVSNMLSASIKDITTHTEKIASSVEVINYLHHKGDEKKVLRVLNQLTEDGTSMLVELLDTNFNVLLSIGKPAYRSGTARAKKRNAVDLISVDNIYAIHDSVFYPVTVTLKAGNDLAGYLTRYRYVKITAKNLEHFSNLAGKGAKLYVGNNDKSLYTDLFHPANYIPPKKLPKEGDIFETLLPDGNKIIGCVHYIGGTPWHAVLLFPKHVIVQGSRQFLFWLILIGLILITAGITGAWFMSGRLTRPLNRLALAVNNFASENGSGSSVEKGDEVETLSLYFALMMEKLQLAKVKMEQKIIESEALNKQLRSLSSHLQHVREQERRHVAKELHDELGQLLAGARMKAHLIKKRLNKETDMSLRDSITAMENEMDDAIRIVKRVASDLRGGPLDDLGLVAALEWYCNSYNKRLGIPVELITSEKYFACSEIIAHGLFSICQEALTNIAKHASATQVVVSLSIKNEELILTITDNGKGFDVYKENNKQQTGLIGIKERVIMMGGKLNIKSAPSTGTTVEVIVSLKQPLDLSHLP